MAKCGFCGVAGIGHHACRGKKLPQNPADFAVSEAKSEIRVAKSAKVRRPESPLKSAEKAWSLAITQTDRHSGKCKRGCHRREPLATVAWNIYDPFTPCRVALDLAREEDAARSAYQALGGLLPVGA